MPRSAAAVTAPPKPRARPIAAPRPRATPALEPEARPFLKWAGGKWSLAPELHQLLPKDLGERVYREPFLGGGALFFYLMGVQPPREAHLSDALADLVAAYCAVRDQPAKLATKLEELRAAHDEAHYYGVRDRFNAERAAPANQRAAWLIYLNKTCYNGLFRTNRGGAFNVPMGRFVNPRVVDPPRLFAASRALAHASIAHRSYDHLRATARAGDVIYLDPPYVPLSKTANFDAYAHGAFGPAEQERLAALFRELDERGCLLVLSNSDTPEVRRLYRGFALRSLTASRSISRAGQSRLPVNELVVRNLARW